jgi:hypothetical protein
MQGKSYIAIVLGSLSALLLICAVVLGALYFEQKNLQATQQTQIDKMLSEQKELSAKNSDLTTQLGELKIAYEESNTVSDGETPVENTDNVPTPTPTPVPTVSALTRTIKLYVFNKTKDPNVLNCAANDFVYRTIPGSMTPLSDTVKALFSTPLTDAEKTAGMHNYYNEPGNPEFDNSGAVSLKSASISNGVATLTLDNSALTNGGSCRANILKTQLEMTAMQFSSVTSVKVLPELLFQP